MNTNSRLEQANDNAAAFWLAQARAHGWQSDVRQGLTAVRCARTPDDSQRFVVTRPYAEPADVEKQLADLMADWETIRFTLEDPYSGLDLTRFGAVRMPIMPVMAREPGPVEGVAGELPVVSRAHGGGTLTVDEAVDGHTFALVERTIVDGFPLPARQPWRHGEALPEQLLREPGCRAWIARLDGTPAGASLTYDDGTATGVYWVATLPDQRGQGVARAVLQTALTHAHPDRPATLVATSAGEPLYRKLGFTAQTPTCWWSRTSPGG
ncbi:GNAT family N-acetyltransferase [Kitasatospora cathayae]|uniref:GNAT family N-acetyltransferase n=1 Tax=Kitasatospora cathayae TaxID=3004092 RepID=A0ABY7Q7Y3_9ACTN|nr:GNAT family N-acetyltransferase [Kitasatospora sp. HUAS 3-15]WBP88763.1 GNAT family N-acetyltransferase [Kitasatospora sp. HUAS 3-15]